MVNELNKISIKKQSTLADKPKIALGLSGGVDSAVAAYLLKEEGYDVSAFYLQCWDFDLPGCGGDKDRNDAIHVAATLDIKFKHLDFIEEYKKRVLDKFYKEYRSGRTPNPDIVCNTQIKYGIFLDWALRKGFDCIATGHYARKAVEGDCFQLLSGVDKGKDQSYFLYRLNQEQLERALFPLGEMLKKDVRNIAKEAGLRVHDKTDSVGICFIGDVDIKKFLQERINPEKGEVVTEEGKKIGSHSGVWFYTIGQRHGFEVTEYMGVPLYVIDKNVEENQLIVGSMEDAKRDTFFVEDLHWICKVPDFPLETQVRIRNLGKFYPSKISSSRGGELKVESEESIFGVAPGQSAVFYEGDLVLGGGIISR